MALGVRTVECIVAIEVDQCQLCLADLQEGVDNETFSAQEGAYVYMHIYLSSSGWDCVFHTIIIGLISLLFKNRYLNVLLSESIDCLRWAGAEAPMVREHRKAF